MFEWKPEERLPTSAETIKALKALGDVMKDSPQSTRTNDIPAAYTYFGQFVDHDITRDTGSATMAGLAANNLTPLGTIDVLENKRSARLDLDSVYFAELPRDAEDNRKLKLGAPTRLNSDQKPRKRPTGKSNANDLPRNNPNPDQEVDRAAQIGDPRNDENIIVAQLHTAFLKAHNVLVDRLGDFAKAREQLTLRYQSVVLHDFLKRVCDKDVYAAVLRDGPKHWKIASRDALFMPAEFSFAAYRFGHSMIRTEYNYNLNFPEATLDELFTFTALSGQIGGGGIPEFPQIPDNWIIEWENILKMPSSTTIQNAHPIDTQLTNVLFKLKDTFGKLEGKDGPPQVAELAPVLAKRNLLRGYLLALPTGQAVARRLGFEPLQGDALLAVLPASMREAATGFKDATPLWFYVLAEAGANGGRHLGKVGTTLVIETFWNLIKHSEISILNSDNLKLIGGEQTLAGLIELAAVADTGAP